MTIVIDICSDRDLFELEYADNVVTPNEDPTKLYALLGHLNDSVHFGCFLYLRSVK